MRAAPLQTEHHLCLALEYVEGGNMHSDLLYGPYSLPRTVFYAAQICLALDHIHSLDILYRDQSRTTSCST